MFNHTTKNYANDTSLMSLSNYQGGNLLGATSSGNPYNQTSGSTTNLKLIGHQTGHNNSSSQSRINIADSCFQLGGTIEKKNNVIDLQSQTYQHTF
jgi:hypothetical protein